MCSHWQREEGFGTDRQSQVFVHWCWWPIYDLSKKEFQLFVHVESLWHAMTPASLRRHTSRPLSFSWLSLCPTSSFRMPFNLPASVYIACVTIWVLLAVIMKGTVSICCFLYLLLLQATAGKNIYLVLCRVMHCEHYIYLCTAAPNGWIGDMVLV